MAHCSIAIPSPITVAFNERIMLLRWLFSFLPGVTTANHILYISSQLFYIRVIISSSQIWFMLALWVYLKGGLKP